MKSELIDLKEIESNLKSSVSCPKCCNETVIKKTSTVDIPKALGFFLLMGASFALIVLVNVIIMIRGRFKRKKLPNGLKEIAPKPGNNIRTFLNLQVPTQTKIQCSKCNFKFYETYDTGDLILVLAFCIIFFILVLSFVFYFTQKEKLLNSI